MAADALQKNQNSPSQVSYIKAAAAGSLMGYSLKYLIPVISSERDEKFNDALKQNRLDADTKKLAAIETIRQSKNKTELTDTFIRMHDANKLQEENIKKLKSPLRQGLLDMLKELNAKTAENIAVGKKNIEAITKSIRPTHIFVGAGLVIGFLAALGTNLIRRIDYYNAQCKED